MDQKSKKFHLQELNWLIHFPASGNQGKYSQYSVVLKKGNSLTEKNVKLYEILESLEFEQNFPHTVGYYKNSTGENGEFRPDYMEIRKINTVEDFWLFLNALDI